MALIQMMETDQVVQLQTGISNLNQFWFHVQVLVYE